MQRNKIKYGIIATAALFVFAFASCDKNDSIPVEQTTSTAIDYSTPYTEVLTVPKDYYSVGQSGKVYTAHEHLYSKVHAKVMLTKYSERNASTFSLSETETEYVMTVQRVKAKVLHTKVQEEISTADPEELTKWIIEATLEGYDVYICFDPETGRWNGHIIKD